MRPGPYRNEAEVADESGVEKMLYAENNQRERDEEAAEPRKRSVGGIAVRNVSEQKEAGVRGGLEYAATPAGRLVMG
jgi:hypothetical protein